MGDIGAFHFPYQNISVPNGIPFYPVVTIGENDSVKISFNQGYVFDFTSVKNNEGVYKIKVEDCDKKFDAKNKSFYLQIKTSEDLANVLSATVKEGEATSDETNNHYSAKNLDGNDVYKNKSGDFQIPICTTDENGNVKNLYLRENVHWQKINFENTPREASCAESLGVLFNWGDGTSFNDNPTVKFSNLVQLEQEREQIIKLERAAGGKNIVIKTQLPLANKNEMSVLYRTSSNEWVFLQADKSKYQILINDNGELKFFDTPDSAADGLQLLGSDGNNLKWVKTEECPSSN